MRIRPVDKMLGRDNLKVTRPSENVTTYILEAERIRSHDPQRAATLFYISGLLNLTRRKVSEADACFDATLRVDPAYDPVKRGFVRHSVRFDPVRAPDLITDTVCILEGVWYDLDKVAEAFNQRRPINLEGIRRG